MLTPATDLLLNLKPLVPVDVFDSLEVGAEALVAPKLTFCSGLESSFAPSVVAAPGALKQNPADDVPLEEVSVVVVALDDSFLAPNENPAGAVGLAAAKSAGSFAPKDTFPASFGFVAANENLQATACLAAAGSSGDFAPKVTFPAALGFEKNDDLLLLVEDPPKVALAAACASFSDILGLEVSLDTPGLSVSQETHLSAAVGGFWTKHAAHFQDPAATINMCAGHPPPDEVLVLFFVADDVLELDLFADFAEGVFFLTLLFAAILASGTLPFVDLGFFVVDGRARAPSFGGSANVNENCCFLVLASATMVLQPSVPTFMEAGGENTKRGLGMSSMSFESSDKPILRARSLDVGVRVFVSLPLLSTLDVVSTDRLLLLERLPTCLSFLPLDGFVDEVEEDCCEEALTALGVWNRFATRIGDCCCDCNCGIEGGDTTVSARDGGFDPDFGLRLTKRFPTFLATRFADEALRALRLLDVENKAALPSCIKEPENPGCPAATASSIGVLILSRVSKIILATSLECLLVEFAFFWLEDDVKTKRDFGVMRSLRGVAVRVLRGVNFALRGRLILPRMVLGKELLFRGSYAGDRVDEYTRCRDMVGFVITLTVFCECPNRALLWPVAMYMFRLGLAEPQ